MAMRRTKPHKSNVKPTRKQIRKEKRKEKKIKRNEFYTNRRKAGKFVLAPNRTASSKQPVGHFKDKTKKTVKNDVTTNNVPTIEALRNKEQKEKNKLQKEMNKQRIKQLLDANIEEDRNIKQLEKQLKLHKRKSKSVPKSFAEDGLDYLLEVCDSKTMSSAVAAEQELNEVNDEFEEDFTLMAGITKKREDEQEDSYSEDNSNGHEQTDSESEEFEDDGDSNEEQSEYETDEDMEEENDTKKLNVSEKVKTKTKGESNLQELQKEDIKTKKRKQSFESDIMNKKTKLDSGSSSDESGSYDESETDEDEAKSAMKENEDGTWEDIYGRLRAKDGRVVNVSL